MRGRLYNATEVADLLGLQLDTIYRYARAGELPGVKLGKLWRFAEADVEAFINSRRHDSKTLKTLPRLLPEILTRLADDENTGSIVSAESTLSMAEVDRFSNRLASALAASGVRAGDRVVAVLPHSPEFVITCFAVWKLQAIVVPEDSTTHPDTFRHILQDTQPAALVIDRNTAAQIEAMSDVLETVKAAWIKDSAFALPSIPGVNVHSLDSAFETDGTFEWTAARVSPDDVVSISYTSGSTGLPKGAMHTHDSWLAAAEFTLANAGLSSEDQIVVPLPLHHAYSFRQILAYMMAGATIILANDIYQALKLLRQYKPSALLLVPAATNILLDHFAELLSDADRCLRYLEIGSASFAASRMNQLQDLVPTTRVNLPYGLTEARVAFLRAGADGVLNEIFDISPELELMIADKSGEPVRPGQAGEIMLRGRGLFSGYWQITDPSLRRDPEEWFPTGDLARLNDIGTPALLGRRDEVLKIGGRKVSPAEVETTLDQHPAIAESAVIGKPDPKGLMEIELHAFVVSRNGAEPSEAELLAHCRRQLERHKVPARIHMLTSLPKSPIGKIQRHVL